jgi:hypothetical protein
MDEAQAQEKKPTLIVVRTRVERPQVFLTQSKTLLELQHLSELSSEMHHWVFSLKPGLQAQVNNVFDGMPLLLELHAGADELTALLKRIRTLVFEERFDNPENAKLKLEWLVVKLTEELALERRRLGVDVNYK